VTADYVTPISSQVNSVVTGLLRELGPQTLGVLVRRGADFAVAEDAVQEALIEATHRWPNHQPDDPLAG
jgi:predicted RNA polymerase sigma factor